MTQIRVFKDTKQRANEFAQYTSQDGTRYPHVPRDLLEWADVAPEPDDYSPDTYDRQEVMESPYIVYTKKSDEQLAQIAQAKLNQASLAYLAETDWMVLRAQEDPAKPVPLEVAAKRQAAREAIVRLDP